MIKMKWIQAHDDQVQQLEELLRFFGVATPEQWSVTWEQLYGKRGYGWDENPLVWVYELLKGGDAARTGLAPGVVV